VKKKIIKTKKDIQDIIVISDTHIGCRLGLCCPTGIQLDDGGVYLPSKLQLKVWSWWEEFWNKWVPEVTKGRPYAVVHNGDAIDGVHHNSTTQISHNLEDQISLAYKILKPIVAKCEGRYYHVRGTESHVAKSGREEERLAKLLGAIPNEERQYARWELWMDIDGKLAHFLHHIGTTSSAAHETSAINAEITASFNESVRWGEKRPSFIVRSHRHRSAEVRIPTNDGYCTGVVTPAWQLKTPYTYKIAGARLAPPQMGGILIHIGDRLYTDTFVKNIERTKPVSL
jgi:hypothetical protein